ncbi:MAG: SpoIIE family protein phosphatase [Oscillospiraceae bacterium]|nr:SpoIIE family protein phosphatase [Oscillospiraceae bacterium]
MKRIKNLVIGGIQSKIFNLILLTVILLTVAFSAVSLHHASMLEQLALESNQQMLEAIQADTEDVIDGIDGAQTDWNARTADALWQRYEQIQAENAQIYKQSIDHSRATATVLLISVAVLMLTGALVLAKRIVAPLNTITQRISELREGSLEFKMEDAYRTGDEIEELARSFARLSHKTVAYMETIQQVTAEKERISTELSLANQIQAAMLPHIIPAFPDRTDFDIIARMAPAKEVGGDFYDYFLIDDDHLCMVMADVSGKGVPAALFMMASKIILQSVAMLGKSPAEILEKTNEAICSNNEAEMFVTVWLGILTLSTGTLTAANAGHEYMVRKHADGHFELYKDKHGFVLGGMEGMRYQQYELQLEPGSKLFIYTDGVPEATDARQELFGTERMVSALNEEPDASPQEILQNVQRAVDNFVGDAEQFDDLTMLCLEYKGPQEIPVIAPQKTEPDTQA